MGEATLQSRIERLEKIVLNIQIKENKLEKSIGDLQNNGGALFDRIEKLERYAENHGDRIRDVEVKYVPLPYRVSNIEDAIKRLVKPKESQSKYGLLTKGEVPTLEGRVEKLERLAVTELAITLKDVDNKFAQLFERIDDLEEFAQKLTSPIPTERKSTEDNVKTDALGEASSWPAFKLRSPEALESLTKEIKQLGDRTERLDQIPSLSEKEEDKIRYEILEEKYNNLMHRHGDTLTSAREDGRQAAIKVVMNEKIDLKILQAKASDKRDILTAGLLIEQTDTILKRLGEAGKDTEEEMVP